MPEPSDQTKKPRTKPRQVPVGVTIRHQGFDREIEAIRRYLEMVTSTFRRELDSYKAYLLRTRKISSDDDAQAVGEDIGEAEHYYADAFPLIALQTTFVSIYTLLEHEMLDLARWAGSKRGDARNPERIPRDGRCMSGIYAARAFFNDHSVPVPTGPTWSEVEAYYSIRNAVAHCRCDLRHARGSAKVRAYVAVNPTLLTIENDRIRLSEEFVAHALNNVAAFMTELYVTVRRLF
jgi:hypothetical protein